MEETAFNSQSAVFWWCLLQLQSVWPGLAACCRSSLQRSDLFISSFPVISFIQPSNSHHCRACFLYGSLPRWLAWNTF